MKDASDVTACVIDGGLFPELALRLARDYKRVLYQCTLEPPSPTINAAIVGDGFNEFKRIDDFWLHKKEIDLFIFPDCAHLGEQAELVAQGKAVWGSGSGANLELDREGFKRVLEAEGLHVVPYAVVVGVSALRKHLKNQREKWVKLSKYRGTKETWHWVDWQTSSPELDMLAVDLGPAAEQVRFIVEDHIETKIEWGYDGFFYGGRFDRLSCHGPEIKNKSYAGALVERGDLPEQVSQIIEAISPRLAAAHYRNAFSAEVRIDAQGRGHFTDPTCRFPWPASPGPMELWRNLGEVILTGANSEHIGLEADWPFCIEAAIFHVDDKERWRRLVVPNKIRRWVKLNYVCRSGEECYDFPPLPDPGESVGSVVGVGNTIAEALEMVKGIAKELAGQPVDVKVESLAEGLREIALAESQGLEFTEQAIPEPETVLQHD